MQRIRTAVISLPFIRKSTLVYSNEPLDESQVRMLMKRLHSVFTLIGGLFIKGLLFMVAVVVIVC